jgi:Spy/CpxP family protein refolding chaperone
MRSRLLLAIAAMLTLAACSESTTAPRAISPGVRSADVNPEPDGTCRSGYHGATRSDGTVTCEAD